MRNNLKQAAFTLAEVLIVLSIIGIIADMTIPTLVANVQKERTVTMLKKAYSEFAQAMKMAEVDNGMMDGWILGDGSLATTQSFADTYLYPYIKTLKKCAQGETGCWSPSISLDMAVSSTANPSYANAISAVTASGYSILFYSAGTSPNTLVGIYVDVNGPEKGTGKLGKDVFFYVFRKTGTPTGKQGLNPQGLISIPPLTRTQLKSSSAACVKPATITGANTQAGIYCAALIMIDDWQIKDDYPWN